MNQSVETMAVMTVEKWNVEQQQQSGSSDDDDVKWLEQLRMDWRKELYQTTNHVHHSVQYNAIDASQYSTSILAGSKIFS